MKRPAMDRMSHTLLLLPFLALVTLLLAGVRIRWLLWKAGSSTARPAHHSLAHTCWWTLNAFASHPLAVESGSLLLATCWALVRLSNGEPGCSKYDGVPVERLSGHRNIPDGHEEPDLSHAPDRRDTVA